MKYDVLILSLDDVFAKMIKLEFLMQRKCCAVVSALSPQNTASVLLWDMDSTELSQKGNVTHIIGFTRRYSISEMDPDRLCSMILHRPFEMRLLREEVEALLPMAAPSKRDTAEHSISVKLMDHSLFVGSEQLPLSPTEFSIVELLLSRKGTPVSRKELSAQIGASQANKVDVYICYLRRKIASVTDRPIIFTVRGKGYQIS